MNHFSDLNKDILKVYFFYFIGLCAGYLGTFDKVNILIVTLPTLLLIKNTGFDFETAKVKFEKQKTINLIISLVNNSLEVARNNGLNTEELKAKVLEIFQTFFNEMGVSSILGNFGISSIFSLLQNSRL
jgi:hypothetical protein